MGRTVPHVFRCSFTLFTFIYFSCIHWGRHLKVILVTVALCSASQCEFPLTQLLHSETQHQPCSLAPTPSSYFSLQKSIDLITGVIKRGGSQAPELWRGTMKAAFHLSHIEIYWLCFSLLLRITTGQKLNNKHIIISYLWFPLVGPQLLCIMCRALNKHYKSVVLSVLMSWCWLGFRPGSICSSRFSWGLTVTLVWLRPAYQYSL